MNEVIIPDICTIILYDPRVIKPAARYTSYYSYVDLTASIIKLIFRISIYLFIILVEFKEVF